MKTNNYKKAELRENPFNADVRLLLDSDEQMVLHLHLKAGQMLETYKTETEAVFYVLEGRPQIEIEDASEFAEKDDVVLCPAGSMHCINNPGDQEARILVIKQK